MKSRGDQAALFIWSWIAIGLGYLWGTRGFLAAAEGWAAILVAVLALYGALAYSKRAIG